MYVLIYLFYAVEVVYKILNSRTFSSVSVAKVTFFYRQPVLGLSFVCVVVEAMLSPPLFYFSFALLDSKFSPSAPFPLVVQSQVDLRLHRRNVAEGTKATWLEWKISTESGKERVGSIGKGWNIRMGSDKPDMWLLHMFMGCLNEAGAFNAVDR